LGSFSRVTALFTEKGGCVKVVAEDGNITIEIPSDTPEDLAPRLLAFASDIRDALNKLTDLDTVSGSVNTSEASLVATLGTGDGRTIVVREPEYPANEQVVRHIHTDEDDTLGWMPITNGLNLVRRLGFSRW
jgi:hypothetical protein